MTNLISRVPIPHNEPVLNYGVGSPETVALQKKLSELLSAPVDIPAIINGKEVRTGDCQSISPPHNHRHKLGSYHRVGPKEAKSAIEGALQAYREWSRMPAKVRAAIFLKAAELLTGKYRYLLNAATMLGQSKTCYQAEIDSACELIDFFRFNVAFQEELYGIQPLSAPGMWNQMEYRPLEGFVFAVTPFNFTSIAGNLPTAPALMGNVAVWKPASTAVYSGYFIMKLLMEAGLPDGVIQFLPGSGSVLGEAVFSHSSLAGVHFTGSTAVFQQMWKTVGDNLGRYRGYPRLVGETGGKDFIFAHPSADPEALRTAMIRGAFEYQGQKCSAASRAYIPQSLWRVLKESLVSELSTVSLGDVTEFKHFMSAVIDEASFNNIKGYIDEAKKSSDVSLVYGGECQRDIGYFVSPTVLEVKNPRYRTMCEEIFGPVLTVYPYEDKQFEEVLKICDETSPYALTGAIFGRDRKALEYATSALTYSAGNFYINNKPTGAVVGHQPFGGARGSGTNDKAGSLFNLMRWVSVRTVSETFAPPLSFRYPFMG